MKYLNKITFNKTGYGVEVFVMLADEWKQAARKFPVERINEVLEPSVKFARDCIQDQLIELRTDKELGLTGISLLGSRAGLGFYPFQEVYMSHNLTKPTQVLAITAIITDYLKLLEDL